MTGPRPDDFVAFFRAVYGNDKHGMPIEPFPWQMRLAKRACDGGWPKCIALPTAAGKTACIDIAVFALACQAGFLPRNRTAPRRVFFVVDRRVVVDQAFLHANHLATRLSNAKTGVLKATADALRAIAAGDRPLDVYPLRGGLYRESAWVRSPLQPTIITSTVDQVGSRLLFRGYGVSDSCKPLHAALVGNDALILLDEAHCARPFDQTMALVEKYRSWAEDPLKAPFRFVTMTATPSGEPPDRDLERIRADDSRHPVLGRRIKASKPARLVIAERARGGKWRTELVNALVTHARSLAAEGFRAVGVIVNRVATARETAASLKRDGVDVILLTGRMRPLDRDATTADLEPLFSGKSGDLHKPTFVVATQCLEVGADLDLHALVTECASLDALRQRFGRLNRIAARSEAKAIVVIRADQTEPSEDAAKQDPVYGKSLACTWEWLKEHATDQVFDFGVAAVARLTTGMNAEELAALSAPASDAAVLFPSHLDAWCQTSPIPAPDPDPAVFLHGPSRSVPDVQVVFRADLRWDETKSTEENERTWTEIISLCPPSSSEALPVRLDVFHRWLASEDAPDDSSDVEGDASAAANADEEDAPALVRRRALRWRGPESKETRIIDSTAGPSRGGRPHDLYVVPIAHGMGLENLGDFPGESVTDVGDEGFQRARDRAILRLTPSLLNLRVAFDEGEPEQRLSEAIDSLGAAERAKPLSEQRPWLLRAADSLSRKSNRIVKPHPLGGSVVIGKKRLHQFDASFSEAEESWEAPSDRPYPLAAHCEDVAFLARRFAQHSGLDAYASSLEAAGQLHDAGKADPRFQAWMHGGNRRNADLQPHPLAKSVIAMPRPHDRAEARRRAGYPEGGRHELLSVRLAECDGAVPQSLGEGARDLILHLIAAHHGSCRPFAPIVEDVDSVPFAYVHDGRPLAFASHPATISGHGLERLDSGVAERFWRLTRRFGWWGLPWLESMLRLADWACSDPDDAKNAFAGTPGAATRTAPVLEAAL